MHYTLIRSRRKSVAIQIQNGQVIVRAPQRTPLRYIEEFLESKRDWIEKGMALQAAMPQYPPFTAEEIRTMAEAARVEIPKRAAYFAPMIGVRYGRITIRNQRTKWGSCSSKGNLNFNCLLMLLPDEVVDSVVAHELCHRKHMNHSKAFYDDLTRVFPNYQQCRTWLKENGGQYLSRLH